MLLYALYLLRNIALIFAFAGFLAYLLSWPIEQIARRWPRWAAVTLVFGGFIILMLGLVVAIIPVTFKQTQDLITTIPDIIMRLEDSLAGLRLQVLPGRELDLTTYLDELLTRVQQSTPSLFSNLYSFTQTFVSGTATVASAVIVIPLVTLYFLMDSARLRKALLGCFPRHMQGDVNLTLTAVNRSLGSYIYSRVLLALFVGITMTALLAILGVRYSLLLGTFAFVGEFIPVVGAWISLIVIAIITLATEPLDLIWIIVFTIVIQMVQNYVLAPKLTGDAMDLHPLTVIIAMLIGGSMGGIAGLVVAIPAAAALKVILSVFVFRREDRGISVPTLDLISSTNEADIQEAPHE